MMAYTLQDQPLQDNQRHETLERPVNLPTADLLELHLNDHPVFRFQLK